MIKLSHWNIFLVCLTLLFITHVNAQTDYGLIVQNVTNKNGLSNNHVTCAAQDSTGIIWIGTIDGLNRYDGYKIKTYYNDDEDSTSLSDNHITALCVDKYGDLWIGTRDNGVCRYNPYNDDFVRFKSKYYHSNNALSHYSVTDIQTDIFNNVWVSTHEGISRYNRQNNSFEPIYFYLQFTLYKEHIKLLQKEGIPDNIIQHAYSLREEFFTSKKDFIQTLESKVKKNLDPSTIEEIISLAEKKIPSAYKKFNRIENILPDTHGNLWLTLRKSGFAFFNTQTNEIEHFSIYPIASDSPAANQITSILKDEDNLWLATFDNGVYVYSISQKKITRVFDKYKHGTSAMIRYGRSVMFYSQGSMYYYSTNFNKNKLPRSKSYIIPNITFDVGHLFKDNSGNYWIATNGDGILIMNPKKRFNNWDNSEFSTIKLSKQSVTSINSIEDKLYVGYYKNNIDLIDVNSQKVNTIRDDSNYPGHSANLLTTKFG
jgi:ligand-binding sensor domain-containing protein